MVKLTTKIKNKFYELACTNTSEHDIALGFAIGTFISITIPVVGFLVGLAIAAVFKKINKLSLLGSIVLWNPFFLIPIYALSYEIGNLFFDSPPVTVYNIKIINHIINFSKRYLLGNIILAVTISIASYFMVRFAVIEYRKYRKLVND